jgi:hypothetical protein
MTAAQDEGWIQGSLARLETLEAQRQQLAAKGQTAALAEVDEEIRALYEVLESAAGDEQAPANMGMAPAMSVAPPPMSVAPPPMSVAPPPMSVAPAPMGMAPPPMGMAPTPGMVMEPMPVSSSLEMLDEPKPRSTMPFIIGGVLVAVLGIGGAVVMSSGNDKEARPGPTEPAKEIKAGAISADTQEPVVAKGADADRTAGTKYRERPEADQPERRSSSGSSSGVSRPRSKKEDDARKLTVEKSKDPLAGID